MRPVIPTMQSERVALSYEVDRERDDWVLPGHRGPEPEPHALVCEQIKALLIGVAGRSGKRMKIGRNLAIHWSQEHPQIGVDPDVCVFEPPPPTDADLLSLRLWEEGHFPPLLAVEVVSESRTGKDYSVLQDKYAASGVRELWMLDPTMCGPKALGGPFRIQVWKREPNGDFRRVYTGEGPAFSDAVGAWLFAVNKGSSFRIADNEAGTSSWTTPK